MATILIVDDERQVRESLSALLSAKGVDRVETAESVHEAKEHAARQPPDVLIVDYMLGDDMDGLQLAESLRHTNPQLETILMSGYLSNELQQRIEAMTQIKAYSKPCPPDEFMQAIDDALSKFGE